jgi:hypothetical protein
LIPDTARARGRAISRETAVLYGTAWFDSVGSLTKNMDAVDLSMRFELG